MIVFTVSKYNQGGCWCSREGWDEQGGAPVSPQASMGLDTMLFGVSGSWDDMDATSLPVELEPGPPSEKLTCGTRAAVRHMDTP